MDKQKNSFGNRLKTMISVDFRRMFTSPLLYIMLAISFVMPILILVMTTMMDGNVTVNPSTGTQTTIEGFKNVWQIIGSSNGDGMNMDITSMCNINMMFFVIAVFVCIFISSDFRSGYCKNLFTVRSKKNDYIFSKIIVGFVAGCAMLLFFFLGAMVGGAVSGLPFTLDGISVGNIICSMLSKFFLVSIFVAIFTLASVIAKQRLWLSILLSLGIGMLFFTMIPIISPINATFVNVLLCLIGGGIFATGISIGSYYILKKTSII